MLKLGFWLLMLTGNEFWQDFWETYETSSKYELPQVDSTTLHPFTVLQCQRQAIPTFRRTDRFHSRGRQLCKFLGTNGSFYLRKEFNPHRIFLYFNMTAVLLFCTPIWPPWRHVTTICRATGRVVFKTSENFSKRSLHFIFRRNITP